jgi:hypothetical protein
MSLWLCPDHGLFGGQVTCPTCGKVGDYADMSLSDQREHAKEAIRHAWDDLFDELRWEGVVNVRRT